MIVMVEN